MRNGIGDDVWLVHSMGMFEQILQPPRAASNDATVLI
jgi:hypothetical protein